MKTHRRQELKENELAHFLQEWGNYVRTNGSRVVLGAAVVGVVVFLAWSILQSKQQTSAMVWQRLNALPLGDYDGMKESLSELRLLADDASSETLGLTVLSKWAEVALRLVSLAPNDFEKSQHNEEAASALERLIDRFPDNPLAIGTASCGLATVEENRFVFTGDLAGRDKAKAHLERVRDEPRLNGTPFMTQALDRLNRLDDIFVTVTFAPPPPPETGPPAPEGGEAVGDPVAVNDSEEPSGERIDEGDESADQTGLDDPAGEDDSEDKPSDAPPNEPGRP